MKVIVIIVVAILVMALLGWMSFSKHDGSASITIDTEKIEKDTKQAAEKTEELVDKAVEKGRELVDDKSDNSTDEANELPDKTEPAKEPVTVP